ncbi:hypothetical protein OG440_32540 [Streptomyces sp. NBC_00637]|uniref:hypothetical protein n=1 Tax=Streptomyces sp. NBC_00637 TaxID=2903667 RepID=UPI003243B8F7
MTRRVETAGSLLFGGPGAGRWDDERVRAVAVPLATHLEYRFVPRGVGPAWAAGAAGPAGAAEAATGL